MKQTMEQQRADHAWKKAREGVMAYGKDYINDAKGLPALIMNSGLMQVMAYMQGKKEERYHMLAKHLREWLHQARKTPGDFEGFMGYLLGADPREFQAVNAEAFAWLKWLRQMAPAVQRED